MCILHLAMMHWPLKEGFYIMEDVPWIFFWLKVLHVLQMWYGAKGLSAEFQHFAVAYMS